MAWTPEQQAELDFYRLLENESDRGCALVASAYLEDRLEEVLSGRMVQDDNVEDFFRGTQPLATFSARIALAYYLGIISREARQDLDTIRRIRNDFAHDLQFETFNNQSISNRCKNLQICVRSEHTTTRDKFIDAATSLNLVLDGHRARSRRPEVDPLELAGIHDIRKTDAET